MAGRRRVELRELGRVPVRDDVRRCSGACAGVPCGAASAAVAETFAQGLFSWPSLVELASFVLPSEDEAWADRVTRISAARLQLEARRARRIKREDAETAQQERFVKKWRDRQGFLRMSTRIPPAEAAVVETALDREIERLRAPPSAEYETYSQLQCDALVEMCKVRLGADTDIDRATVMIHVDARDLNSLSGSAMFEDGTVVSSEVARRLACDGRIQTITHDAAGNPLNLGRRSRVASPAQIRELKKRDGDHCVICGSDVALEAHHIIHWAHGGRTDLDNLALVCWKCHCLIHDKRFRLVRDSHDGFRLLRPDGRFVQNRPMPLRPRVRERILGPPNRVG